MGLPLTGSSYIYGDNMSFIKNNQRTDSTLKKKNNSICYHAMRESIAMGESPASHITTIFNLSDMLTNKFFGQNKRGVVEGVLHHFFG